MSVLVGNSPSWQKLNLWARKCVKNVGLFVAPPRIFAPAVCATFTCDFLIVTNIHSSVFSVPGCCLSRYFCVLIFSTQQSKRGTIGFIFPCRRRFMSTVSHPRRTTVEDEISVKVSRLPRSLARLRAFSASLPLGPRPPARAPLAQTPSPPAYTYSPLSVSPILRIPRSLARSLF